MIRVFVDPDQQGLVNWMKQYLKSCDGCPFYEPIVGVSYLNTGEEVRQEGHICNHPFFEPDYTSGVREYWCPMEVFL